MSFIQMQLMLTAATVIQRRTWARFPDCAPRPPSDGPSDDGFQLTLSVSKFSYLINAFCSPIFGAPSLVPWAAAPVAYPSIHHCCHPTNSIKSTEEKTRPDAVSSKSRLIQSHLSILQFETCDICMVSLHCEFYCAQQGDLML